jgi:3-dehydroquinate synthetase
MEHTELYNRLIKWLDEEFATVEDVKEWFKISDAYHVVTDNSVRVAYLVKIGGGTFKQVAAFNAEIVDLSDIVTVFIDLSSK